MGRCATSLFFFFNDTATTEIYTLSLHDALPISCRNGPYARPSRAPGSPGRRRRDRGGASRSCCRRSRDRKSTRLNSSHLVISYAVFCLNKKKRKSASPRACEDPHRQRFVAVLGS